MTLAGNWNAGSCNAESCSAFKRLLADQSGATSIEYGQICAMIALAMVAAVGMTGDSLVAKFSSLLSLFP